MTAGIAVVPAGGRGTRMLPATRTVPKELLPLGDTPVLDLVLDELAAAGVERIVLVGSPEKPALAAHVRELANVEVVEQAKPLGLGDAVLCAAEAVGDHPFVVALPDALVPEGLVARLIERVEDGFDGAIALEPVPAERASSYGTAELGADGAITALVEKSASGHDALAIAGRYVLPGGTFDALRATVPGHDGEHQLTDALQALIAQGVRLAGVVLEPGQHRWDVGSPEGYAAAFAEVVRAGRLG